ncbi:MAG: helix-turn-helix transcriptional regulator [Gammaproteobacteria bacterium]|nr:helix-turn-helix transcriptional regulator [Gammaproteobacteria bacterium]
MNGSAASVFGANVRRCRARIGISQESLAARAGLDRSYIGGIERGERNPALKAIVDLANALDVGPGQLFYGIGDRTSGEDLSASQGGQGVTLRFRYDQHDAKFDLVGATLGELEEVIGVLRSGLVSTSGRADAVAGAFLDAVRRWPNLNPSDIWTFLIHRAYCDRGSHPLAAARLNLEQSWKRTSGWALERVLVQHYAPFLERAGIVLKIGLRSEKKQWFDSIGDPRLLPDKADVLIARKLSGTEQPVGVIHVKASIAERRTDDVPMSQALMEAGLLSVFWTMDVKSHPSATPTNRGEFGQAADGQARSEKRMDFEENGHFSACFSYNGNTIPTPISRKARSRIFVCDFRNPDDLFTKFLRRGADQIHR